MNRSDILRELEIVFRAVFRRPDLNVTEKTSAQDVPEWDSYSHVVLINEIEKKFNVRFALGELLRLQNAGELIDLIRSKN